MTKCGCKKKKCPKCGPCVKERCREYDAQELWCKCKDAVVDITTFTNVTTSRDPCDQYPDPFNPPEGLQDGKDITTIMTQGNGFFVKGQNIICPAQLVLLPPNLPTRWNTHPFEENKITRRQDGCNQERVDKILITVTGVTDCEGCVRTMIYEGELLWVHGSGDLASIKVKKCGGCRGENFNRRVNLDNLCNHPYLEIGNTREYGTARPVHIIGGLYATAQPNLRPFRRKKSTYGENSEEESLEEILDEGEEIYIEELEESEEFEWSEDQSEEEEGGKNRMNVGTGLTPLKRYRCKQYSHGTVASHRYVDPNGMAQMEMIAVSAPGPTSYNVGSVILNAYGNVIGYVTMNKIGAMDQLNLDAVSRSQTTRQRKEFKTETRTRVEAINPFNGNGIIAGPSSRYFLKIYKKMTEVTSKRKCDVEFAEVMESKFGDYRRYLLGYLGVAWEVFDATNLCMHYDKQGRLVPNFKCKEWEDLFCSHEQVGIVVKSVAGQRFPMNARVPGPNTPQTVPYSFTVADDLDLCPNDIIVKADECYLGCEGHQVALGFVLSRKYPGDCVTLSVSKRDCGYPTDLCPYEVELVKMPPYMDFPWYSYFQYKLNTYPTSGDAFDDDLPVIAGAYLLPSS